MRSNIVLALCATSLACGARQRDEPHDSARVTLAASLRGPARDSLRRAHARTSHVVIVSIDGLRPDVIARSGAPTLARLMREGRYATAARTIVPSTTIPSHASMLTGVGPMTHHVLWNDDRADNRAVAVASVFSWAKAEGLSTAAFFSKSKFMQLFPPGSFDSAAAPSRSEGIWPGGMTMTAASRYLRAAAPNLLFVHLAEPDYAGHSHGWMTAEYVDAVRTADESLGRLLAAADSAFGHAYIIIVTADHGGHGRTHGSPRSDDVTIPWIVWGEGVEAGAPLTEAVRTMDTAATALWLLGIELPRSIEGHAVLDAFVRR